jgi:hypothetical protein
MHRRTLEERYNYNLRKQKRLLEDFAEYEYEWSEDLIRWYRAKKIDMPEDEYRACAFFRNREYKNKLGSLTLLYQMYVRCNNELPEITKEMAFDVLRFKYKMYADVLYKGGF